MAGATPRFQLIVEAVTRGEAELARLTGVVNKLTADIERGNNRIAASNKKLATEVKTTGDSIRQALSNPLDAVIGKLTSGAGGMALFAGAAAGLTVGIGAAGLGLKAFVQEASEAAFEVRALSASTGLTTAAADKLRAVAKLAGFDIRNLQEASLDLSIALKDTSGQGETSRQLLRQLGVAAFEATGKTRPLGDVFTDVFDKLSKVSDLTERVNLSRVLGGEDAAKKSQLLISQYAELNQKVAELGFGSRDGLLKSLEESNKELKLLDLQWEKIKGILAQGVSIPLSFFSKGIIAGSTPPAGAGKTGERIDYGKLFDINSFNPLGLPTAPRPDGTFNPFGLPDAAAQAERRGAGFRAGQAGTEDGIKLRLAQIGKDRAQITLQLSSGALDSASFKELNGKLAVFTSEQTTLEMALRSITNRVSNRDSLSNLLIDKSGNNDPLAKALLAREKFVQGLRDSGGSAAQQFKASEAFGGDISDALVARPGSARLNLARLGIGTQTKYGDAGSFTAFDRDIGEFNQGVDPSARAALQEQKDQRERALNTSFAQQFVAFEERKIDLLTGPGGELDAITKIYELKKAGLEQELQYGSEIFNLTERRLQIEQDKTLSILNLQRQKRDEARGLASDFVGSLQSGDPGSFFKQQGGRLINQIGTNALTGTFSRLQSTLGGIGAASGFGGLLKGTLFDPSNAKPIDRVATATERTAAAAETTAAVLTGRSVGGVTLPGAAGLPGFDAIRALGPASGFTGGFRGTLGQIGAGFSSITAAGGLFAGLRSGSIQTGSGTATTAAGLGLNSSASRAANIAGSTAFLAGAGISAVRDFRRGGAGNILSGTATVLGAAAALDPEPISKAVLAIAAASAAIIGSLLPDPKKVRDEQIASLLNSSLYEEATPMQFNLDRLGRGYDTNKRGDYRGMDITININALDAGSVMDSREMIADAVRMSIYEGHGLNRAMQEAVLAI